MHATRIVSAAALVLLLFVQSVSAVSLSPSGIGQVLVYPYYTVNKGQDTLISVVNASGISKAVQVRFLEGYNGRDTLSFVLYLSPHDVWTAAISQVADDGGAMLKTSDASCTDPQIPAAGVALRSADSFHPDDLAALNTKLDRMDRAADQPWTRSTLRQIQRLPGVVSTELAAEAGQERAAYKIRVRSLKALGLTESLERGYRLSPRGEAYLAALDTRAAPASLCTCSQTP